MLITLKQNGKFVTVKNKSKLVCDLCGKGLYVRGRITRCIETHE